MFQDAQLEKDLKESSTIKTQTAVIAEWNMNVAENIYQVGNYRYRPLKTESLFSSLPNSFDVNDEGGFYTDATYSDVTIDGGLDSDTDTPIAFVSAREKERLLYSLEDCFKRNRPTSGINKARFFEGKYTNHSNAQMAQRPRYYMSHKNDNFKYWTSFRYENDEEFGIASDLVNGQYHIEDAAPYVVYKEPVPANRLVVKMQTNVGTVDLGPFSGPSGTSEDPLFGDKNKTTPVSWKIQVLKNDSWIDALTFNTNSSRKNGSPIIGPEGKVELFYGLSIPEKYSRFYLVEEVSSELLLPETEVTGNAYLVKSSESDRGAVFVWNGTSYEQFSPNYSWQLLETETSNQVIYAKELSSPVPFSSSSSLEIKYREFEYIKGIRIVANTMNKVDSTLDIIEISPRLVSEISEKVTDFSLSKSASDLGISGLPVGQLLASTGTINIFDYDQTFNKNNTDSLVANYTTNNLSFKFYEVFFRENGDEIFVPIKTMYSDGFPESKSLDRSVQINLRDLYYFFESQTAPQILIQNASVSYAVSLLLDSIGFSNYFFKRLPNENEHIIPYFFIAPDKTVAEVLSDIAISTQTAMFFDELDNFVMMSKNYIMPGLGERDTDLTLYGSKDFLKNGVLSNQDSSKELANIIELASQDNYVYNDGSINYTSRYIQRSYGSIRQASLIDREKFWIYKPVLLWEVAPTQSVRSVNNELSDQSGYVLGAIPLNSNLTDQVPKVVGGQLINNVMDLGEGVYWITRYRGYFHSNGEIIRYDAVEYSVSGIGNVWVSSVQDYQNYFSNIPFNGKIYPTGLVRIYAEPNYETIDGSLQLSNGPVAKHGRNQFGSDISEHYAGLSPYWSNNENVRGCQMQSEYLFGLNEPSTDGLNLSTTEPAGVNNVVARSTTRNSIIKNFLSTSYKSEKPVENLYSTQTGTVQASALIMNGPSFSTTESPINFLSYVYKPLTNKFRHFGTRMRIVGKIENNEIRGQTGIGSVPYYVSETNDSSKNNNIGGSSGGLAVMVNPNTNIGYYFEVAALSANNVDDYGSSENIHNVLFYKINKNSDNNLAVPIKLFGGLAKIVVDDGRFVGQSRMTGEEVTTVYDLAVEYEDIGTTRRFYLFINDKIVATVDDSSPLPIYNNMGLFVRGSSRIMFENIYAVTNNYAQNTSFSLDTGKIPDVFSEEDLDVSDSFRKYAMSGVVRASYLSGLSPSEPPKYNMYFEEFGSIMREADYFNVRYDKAYPALYAKISPTFNRIKGYTVSGFTASAYGAEFLIFNSTDTAINLDETSGNYLRIQGVTFTQQSQDELTVDNYYENVGDFSSQQLEGSSLVISPNKIKQEYRDIKLSRISNGKKEFSLDAKYIQSQDEARELMSWIMSKVSKPRKSLGVKIFSNPMIQLGDIVSISYKSERGIDELAKESDRFVVYSIDYSKSTEGPEMTIYLSEVI